MDHDHGHWFVIGILSAGVLLAGGTLLKAICEAIAEAGTGPEALSFWAAVLVLAGAATWRVRQS